MWSECKRGGCPRRQCTTFNIYICVYMRIDTSGRERARAKSEASRTFVRPSQGRGRFSTGIVLSVFVSRLRQSRPRGVDISFEKMGGSPQCLSSIYLLSLMINITLSLLTCIVSSSCHCSPCTLSSSPLSFSLPVSSPLWMQCSSLLLW